MNKDRNLLFGVIAVQLKLLTPQRLVEAAGSWATHQEINLSDILVEENIITAPQMEKALEKQRQQGG